ncbi:MAG TPA: enoyl-CoA hydratase/isomerase family protein [Gemmatimonadaceae bacterium]|nr:enoyl-CoA hydratase/isomerase family protein [Gemmatimonadaceae bacterium]
MYGPDLLYEVQDNVAVITFNRPNVRNALRSQSIELLQALLGRVASDPGLRALVLTGAGTAFCAGRDLKDQDALNRDNPPRDAVAALAEQYQDLTRSLTRMEKIVVSAINGVAVGIGAELAAASDVRLAAPGARVAFPEVRRALFLTNGVLYRLPRIVGLGRATEWILTGRMLDADELVAAGFVSRIVAAERLLPDALATARIMTQHAPLPMRMAKDLLNRAYDVDLETMLALERDALVKCVASEDYREGIRAFVEKREPRFTGN